MPLTSKYTDEYSGSNRCTNSGLWPDRSMINQKVKGSPDYPTCYSIDPLTGEKIPFFKPKKNRGMIEKKRGKRTKLCMMCGVRFDVYFHSSCPSCDAADKRNLLRELRSDYIKCKERN